MNANLWAGKPTFFGSSRSILVVENHSYYYPILVYILSSILRTSMQIFGLANHSMVAVKKNIFKWLKVTCVYRLNKLQCYFHFTNTSPLFILQMFLGRLLLSAGLQSVLLNAIVRSAWFSKDYLCHGSLDTYPQFLIQKKLLLLYTDIKNENQCWMINEIMYYQARRNDFRSGWSKIKKIWRDFFFLLNKSQNSGWSWDHPDHPGPPGLIM